MHIICDVVGDWPSIRGHPNERDLSGSTNEWSNSTSCHTCIHSQLIITAALNNNLSWYQFWELITTASSSLEIKHPFKHCSKARWVLLTITSVSWYRDTRKWLQTYTPFPQLVFKRWKPITVTNTVYGHRIQPGCLVWSNDRKPWHTFALPLASSYHLIQLTTRV